MLVLQRAGHDLGRRGGTAVDQHHQGPAVEVVAAGGVELMVGTRVAAADADDRALFQQRVGDVDRGVEHAAGVVAQVQHQALEFAAGLLLQLGQHVVEILAGVDLELRDAHVGIARLKHAAAHAGDLDDVALEVEGQRLRRIVAHHDQLDLGARLAAHLGHGVVDGHALHRGVVDLDDQVARLDAGLGGGSVVDRRDHAHQAALQLHLDAEAAELSGGDHVHVLELGLVEVGRVRIQAGQHAAQSVLQQGLVVDRLDVFGLHLVEDLHEAAQVVERQAGGLRRLALRQHGMSKGNAGAENGAGRQGQDDARRGGHRKNSGNDREEDSTAPSLRLPQGPGGSAPETGGAPAPSGGGWRGAAGPICPASPWDPSGRCPCAPRNTGRSARSRRYCRPWR